MPLVFVHGVNNRKNEDYIIRQHNRDALFRRYTLPDVVSAPETSAIFNPYWGELAAKLAWNGASLPGKKVEALGSENSIGTQILSELAPDAKTSEDEALLVTITNQFGLEKAVDMIWVSAAVMDDRSQEVGPRQAELSQALADLSVDALEYAKSDQHPIWVKQTRTDEDFIERLLNEIHQFAAMPRPSVESFGSNDFRDELKERFGRLLNAIPRAGSELVIDKFRPILNDTLSRFIGDVFVYLNDRGQSEGPSPIAQKLIADLHHASQTRSENDPLIIVAHSMGGNIVYDILTSYLSDFECDILITVGSQVGLFEELKLFKNSDDKIPTKKMPLVAKPKNVKRWINVFDQTDVLSYTGSEIFEGITDYEYNTGIGLFGAHSMYFYRPSFHQRLRERLLEKTL